MSFAGFDMKQCWLQKEEREREGGVGKSSWLHCFLGELGAICYALLCSVLGNISSCLTSVAFLVWAAALHWIVTLVFLPCRAQCPSVSCILTSWLIIVCFFTTQKDEFLLACVQQPQTSLGWEQSSSSSVEWQPVGTDSVLLAPWAARSACLTAGSGSGGAWSAASVQTQSRQAGADP